LKKYYELQFYSCEFKIPLIDFILPFCVGFISPWLHSIIHVMASILIMASKAPYSGEEDPIYVNIEIPNFTPKNNIN